MTTTHTFLSKHFSSLRHAQVLGAFLIGSVFFAGSTFAQLQIDTTYNNSTIVSSKIYVSTDGLATGNNSMISLDGTTGNVHIKGKIYLSNPAYNCPSGECALATSSTGMLLLTGASVGNGTSSGAGNIFTRKGVTAGVDTNAYDVYFADPNVISGANTGYIKVRIGIVPSGTAGGSQLIVKGPIESRMGFVVNSPVNPAEATKPNAGSISGATVSEITTNAGDGVKALTIKSRYSAPGDSNASNIILKSASLATTTKVGINTPLGSYATKSLDVVGASLSRETLTVGYNASGDAATGTRQASAWLPVSTNLEANIIAQGCNQPTIPVLLQCTGAACTTITFTGNYGNFQCYGYYYVGPTMWANLVSTFSYNNKAIFVADTNTMRAGINTLAPQSALDVNGNTFLEGAARIIGDPLNIASISNGFTNARLLEINSRETSPFAGEDMCCKVLSVDRNNNIVLVQLPPTMCTLSVACGGTGNGTFVPPIGNGTGSNGSGSNGSGNIVVGGGLGTIEVGSGSGSGSSGGGGGGGSEDGEENTCPDGQIRDGDQCIENPCADGQIRDADAFACVEEGQQNSCADGQVRDGNQCIEDPCPALGQIRDAEVLACVENPCPKGQIWDLNQCIENPCGEGETYDFVTRTCR